MAATKESKKVSEKTNRDRFGSKKDGTFARFNSKLSTKPKSVRELAEQAGIEHHSFYNHLKALVEKGLVVRSDEGYSIPTNGNGKKASKKTHSKKEESSTAA